MLGTESSEFGIEIDSGVEISLDAGGVVASVAVGVEFDDDPSVPGVDTSEVGAVTRLSVGGSTLTFLLRSSEEPPHAAATTRSAESTRDKRFDITSETLFRFVGVVSSADEISVPDDRQSQEEGLQQQVFVDVQAEATHCRVNVVNSGGEFADSMRIVRV